MRAQWFPRAGETTWHQSVDREVLATRKSVGGCDVTTLGKIDVQGTDAAALLNKIYCNGFVKLAVGKTRYGLMLREDGIAMDDGTGTRLAEGHFVVTTTTANAVSVYRHMEFVRQCQFPDMDVQLVSTAEDWARYAGAGPNSRKLLENSSIRRSRTKRSPLWLAPTSRFAAGCVHDCSEYRLVVNWPMKSPSPQPMATR